MGYKNKGFWNVCIVPVVENDDTSPFILEVQAPWIDEMECLDAIDELFEELHKTIKDKEFFDSLFAIQVRTIEDEIACGKINYIVQDEKCLVEQE